MEITENNESYFRQKNELSCIFRLEQVGDENMLDKEESDLPKRACVFRIEMTPSDVRTHSYSRNQVLSYRTAVLAFTS